jgi:hypothetical protein
VAGVHDLAHRGDGDAGDLVDVPAVDPGADRRHRHRDRADGRRHLQGAPETGGEQIGVGLPGVPVGPDGVDHVAGGELAGAGGHRLADRQPVGVGGGPQPAALLEQRRAGRGVDRAVHPAAAEQ